MLSVAFLFEERNENIKEKLKSLGAHTLGSTALAGLVGGGSALYNKLAQGNIDVPLTTLGTFGLNFALGLPSALRSVKKEQKQSSEGEYL